MVKETSGAAAAEAARAANEPWRGSRKGRRPLRYCHIQFRTAVKMSWSPFFSLSLLLFLSSLSLSNIIYVRPFKKVPVLLDWAGPSSPTAIERWQTNKHGRREVVLIVNGEGKRTTWWQIRDRSRIRIDAGRQKEDSGATSDASRWTIQEGRRKERQRERERDVEVRVERQGDENPSSRSILAIPLWRTVNQRRTVRRSQSWPVGGWWRWGGEPSGGG